MEERLRHDRQAGEERIRADIRDVVTTARADAATARATADAAMLAATKIDGRVTTLEEKAGWVGAGFGATFLAMLGFIWHVLGAKVVR